MIIPTRRFGQLEVEEDHIVAFVSGIPGFDDCKRYVILQPEQYLPFSFIQSVDDGDLSFIITDPFLFFPNYEFELSESTKEELNIREEQDIIVRSVVTANKAELSVNLLAPLIINLNNKQGKQVVLQHTTYLTKHRIQLTQTSK